MDKNSRHDKQAGVGVGGRLRQRLAQMLLRTSCAAATTSATAFVGLAATTAASRRRQPTPPQARPRGAHTHEPRSSMAAVADVGSSSCQRRRRDARRALVHISIDCSAARSSVAAAAAVLQHSAPTLRSKGKGKGGGRGRSRLPPRAPPYGYGWSWSSSSSARDTDGVAAPFSSDGEREEEGAAHTGTSTLFSSRSLSFSDDSASDLYGGTTDNHGGGGGTRPRRRKKKPPSPPPRRAPSRARPAADADTFRPLVGEHRGKKKEEEEEERRPGDGRSRCGCGSAMAASAAAGSTAVVKRSHNPYADFRSSMAEMVAGRRIRGADALSELLVWYLSLNSPRHHPAILAAFEDVWEAVLGSGEP